MQSKPGRSASRLRQAGSSASLLMRTGKLASNGLTPNSKALRPPRKRRPKKGLQNGVRDRNRHRDRSAPRHGRHRRVGFRGHRDGCAPHGDACGGPRRGTTTQRRYLGPCRPALRVRARLPCACGQSARYAGRHGKNFESVLGPLRLERAYYHCELCEAGFCPRDRALGTPGWFALSGRAAHGRTGGCHGQL